MQQKELFIVEGESAASTLVQAINNNTQSVHAIQGKLINVAKASIDAVKANHECQKLIHCLGCGVSPNCVPEKLNYSRILVLMDPDIDGAHSGALVLSFFARYCQPIVSSGRLSLIKAPVFRVSGNTNAPCYAWSEQELEQIRNTSDRRRPQSYTRFKGVAQFSIEECSQLLVNPETRHQRVLK